MLLSILIPTIVTRRQLRARLIKVLQPQTRHRPDVEVLILEDDGEASIGEKRNRLMQRATGAYTVFFDDDDLPPRDYVARIVAALDQMPDCVGFRMRRYSNGELIGYGVNSLACGAYYQRQLPRGLTLYGRTPNHLNPIRRDLALRVPFPAINWGEDRAFAEAVYPLLKREVFIDAVLYNYLYRTPMRRGAEVTNESRLARGVA